MIDMDSEREDPIRITKPENIVETITDENSAKEMVLNDLTTVCNALGTLIKVGEDSNYFSGEKSAQMCIDYLTDNFLEVNNDEDYEETLP